MSKDIWHTKDEIPRQESRVLWKSGNVICGGRFDTHYKCFCGPASQFVDLKKVSRWTYIDDLLALETENKDLSDKIGKLENELNRTRKALDVAVDALKEISLHYQNRLDENKPIQWFAEGDWNGLQAGHGVSRQHWATRHNPLNCHAITSGQNFHMSLGTTKTIATYWAYVGRKYGQDVVDELLNNNESPKLTIAYLKEDCKKQYDFLEQCLLKWNNYMSANRTADEVIKWRCKKFPKTKTDGIMKVLKIIKGEM